jgi:glycosyltransferase involved in cell wall biosynthesis
LKIAIIRGRYYRRNGLLPFEELAKDESVEIDVYASHRLMNVDERSISYSILRPIWFDGSIKWKNDYFFYLILKRCRLPRNVLYLPVRKMRQYDCIIVSENYHVFSFFAALLNNNTIIHVGENIPHPKFQLNPVTLLLKRFVNRKAKKFVCTSPVARRALIHEGVNKSKILVIQNAITIPPYEEKKIYDKSIIFVGKCSKQKGLDLLIRVAEGFDQVKSLTIVGQLADVEIREHPKIRYLGSLDNNEIFKEIRKHSLLVLPSRTEINNEEQFGMVLLEALAVGVPVLVSDVGGMRYVGVEGDTTFVFNEDDERDLMEKLEFVLTKKNNSKTSFQCYDAVRERNSIETISNKWKKLLNL